MQKILFVLPSFEGGGAERVVIELANRLNRERYEPVMVVLENKGPLAGNLDGNIKIISLERARLRQALRPLRHVFREMRPSIVMSTMGYLNLGILWAAGRTTKDTAFVVREANDPDTTFAALPIPAAGRWLYKIYYRRAACIIVPSKIIGQHLEALLPGEVNKIRLLYNPVDDARIRQAAMNPKRLSGPGVRFVAAGRLSHQKGFDRLLEWISRLTPKAHLTILGEGSDRSLLENRITALNLGEFVDLRGFDPSPWAYYAGADAFLLPSRWEGMPNAALEALACGTPVIAMSEAGAVQQIAEEAPPAAITIAETDDEFVRAMQKISARYELRLRDSLLPDSFHIGSVSQSFELLLNSVTAAQVP